MLDTDVSSAKTKIEEAIAEINAALETMDGAVDEILQVVEKSQAQTEGNFTRSLSRIAIACTFHDLCSQRMVKAKKILSFLAETGSLENGTAPTSATASGENALLNGPAQPGEGLDQAAIDELLGEDF